MKRPSEHFFQHVYIYIWYVYIFRSRFIYTLGSPIGQDYKSPKDKISGILSGQIHTCQMESFHPISPASLQQLIWEETTSVVYSVGFKHLWWYNNFFQQYVGVSKNRGTPKWMVYNGSKPY